MPNNPRQSEKRINQVLIAWKTLRPTKTFAGFSYEQFETLVQPCLDTRATIAALENQLIAAQNQRDDADRTALDTIALVVNAVKGDPDEGDDGELYEAMGYVRKSERKSGLRRGKTAAAGS
ncbi:MAG: hypothetical protein ABII82_20310 [Verrucomicrobiota bacterium]